MTLTELAIDVWVSTPGGNLHLNDHVGYFLEASSFVDKAVAFRRATASSPFIDGEFIYNARKNNVTETLAVYVSGSTPYEKDQRLAALIAAIEQPHFTLTRKVGTTPTASQTVWTCYASDYTVGSSRELVHSKMALLKASVLTDPNPVLTEI